MKYRSEWHDIFSCHSDFIIAIIVMTKIFSFLILCYYYSAISQNNIKPIYPETNILKEITVTPVHSYGDNELVGIGSFSFLADGSIIVCDRLDNNLKLFDIHGKIKNRIGKRGKGPGEFRSPYAVAASKTYIAIADYISPRIQIFSNGLVFKKEIFLPGAIFGLQTDENEYIWAGVFEPGGTSGEIIQVDMEGNFKQRVVCSKDSKSMFLNLFIFSISLDNRINVLFLYKNSLLQISNNWQIIDEFYFPCFPKILPYLKLEQQAGEFETGSMIPEDELVLSSCFDRESRFYFLSGGYSISRRRDVFVLNNQNKLLGIIQLPKESFGITIDRDGYLWSVENNRTILTKYLIHNTSIPKGNK